MHFNWLLCESCNADTKFLETTWHTISVWSNLCQQTQSTFEQTSNQLIEILGPWSNTLFSWIHMYNRATFNMYNHATFRALASGHWICLCRRNKVPKSYFLTNKTSRTLTFTENVKEILSTYSISTNLVTNAGDYNVAFCFCKHYLSIQPCHN